MSGDGAVDPADQGEAASALPGTRVYYEGRLDPRGGRRVFWTSLIFSAPAVLAAAAVTGDAASQTPVNWPLVGAAALFIAFAAFAVHASATAWRMAGSKYWVVAEGVFFDAPERLLPISATADVAVFWKKAAGPALKVTGAGPGPAFLFLPGAVLKMGDDMTLYSVQFGPAISDVEKALKARRTS